MIRITMDNFEWDNSKRIHNLRKHGIDFIDSIEIFNDPDRIELEIVINGESRFQTIGTVHDVVLFLVYTNRGNKRRIISVRRASKNERQAYYEA
jgi:uncharacterized DUF497 family protein